MNNLIPPLLQGKVMSISTKNSTGHSTEKWAIMDIKELLKRANNFISSEYTGIYQVRYYGEIYLNNNLVHLFYAILLVPDGEKIYFYYNLRDKMWYLCKREGYI